MRTNRTTSITSFKDPESDWIGKYVDENVMDENVMDENVMDENVMDDISQLEEENVKKNNT